MIRNKRAFPYQVQGLEMKLFASGEYSGGGYNGNFLLDKQLELDKAYYVNIIRKNTAGTVLDTTIISCIFDFLQYPFGGEMKNVYNHEEIYKDAKLLFHTRDKKVEVSALSSSTNLSTIFENAVIYIYEISLLPKGSVN